MTPVDVLITNYNSREAVQLCVESVRHFTEDGDYRLIVYDDCSDNGIDVPYLRAKRDAGWLQLIEGHEKRLHGGALNYLLNERGGAADYAVILDCDIEILRPRWLPRLIDLLTAAPNTIAACNCLLKMQRGPGHWIAPFCEFWFGALNMTAYRDGMQVDWRPEIYTDRPSLRRYAPDVPADKLECYILDVGCKLYRTVQTENPNGYRFVETLPQPVRDSFTHYLQVSHHLGDKSARILEHVGGKMEVIRKRLAEIRRKEGQIENG